MLIQEQVDLKNYCTFRIGGKAKYFANVKTLDELKEALGFAISKQLRKVIFGGGTNLLFDDKEIEALLIRNSLHGIERFSKNEIRVMSGENWLSLHKFCQKQGLYGLEAFSGLPGTLGGAIFGNAGAHGLEMKDVVKSVECIDIDTLDLIDISNAELKFDYRYSILKNHRNLMVTAINIKVSESEADATGDPQEFSKFRKEKQPQGLTTGSFFKNPDGDYAGRLIDQAGLKGTRVGDIMISDKHANFFLNLGKATFQDVITLKERVESTVKEKFGIDLEAEVQIVKA